MSFELIEGTFSSFASYEDVVSRDSRVFEANEGLTGEQVAVFLSQASERILSRIQTSTFWRNYQQKMMPSLGTDPSLIPQVDALKIKSREQDFRDSNCWFALGEYILPSRIDWSNEADVNKVNFYRDLATRLLAELLDDGTWYDFDGDGSIETSEKLRQKTNLVRVR